MDNRTSVKMLIEGYAIPTKEGYIASATCCLVTTPSDKIITDPGCNPKMLREALFREQLATQEIDYVFLSHGHIDHILLASTFTNAKFITYDSNLLYHNDCMQYFKPDFLSFGLQILNTPGHTPEDISLIVPTKKGVYAICGDVFWYWKDEKFTLDIHKADEGADMPTLVESRKKILEIADFVVPGHGKIIPKNVI